MVPALVLIAMILASCTPAAPTRTDRAEPADATYDVFPPIPQFGDSPRAILRNTGGISLEYPQRFPPGDVVRGDVENSSNPD